MQDATPLIRIQDAWLLREHVSKDLHDIQGDNTELPDNDWMADKVVEYKDAWLPYEQKILHGMTESLGLTFRQNIIDVYIAPYFHSFSDPLVIDVTLEPSLFVDVLTHELLHRLLTDNNTLPFEMRLGSEWGRLFGTRPYGELVHIAVFAVHKAIYLDRLRAPERLERDIKNCQKSDIKGYSRAWEYVNDRDYSEIIERLRNSYQRLALGN